MARGDELRWLVLSGGATSTSPAQGNINVINREGLRKLAGVERDIPRNIDVKDFAATFAEEMPVLAHVRAEANRGAIEDDLPH